MTTTGPVVSTAVTTTVARWGSGSESSTPHIDRIAGKARLPQFPIQVISGHEILPEPCRCRATYAKCAEDRAGSTREGSGAGRSGGHVRNSR